MGVISRMLVPNEGAGERLPLAEGKSERLTL
jgi:hypothetical protein